MPRVTCSTAWLPFMTAIEEACTVALQQALILEPNHPEALKLLADLDVLRRTLC